MMPAMDLNTTLSHANDADDAARAEMQAHNPEHAAIYAQLATARSIAALAAAAQNIADALNFHAKP
jgi:hypothetical protein